MSGELWLEAASKHHHGAAGLTWGDLVGFDEIYRNRKSLLPNTHGLYAIFRFHDGKLTPVRIGVCEDHAGFFYTLYDRYVRKAYQLMLPVECQNYFTTWLEITEHDVPASFRHDPYSSYSRRKQYLLHVEKFMISLFQPYGNGLGKNEVIQLEDGDRWRYALSLSFQIAVFSHFSEDNAAQL